MWKITNITKQEFSFYADDGTVVKKANTMVGLKPVGTKEIRYHVLKPGESVISVSRPTDDPLNPRFSIEPVEESEEPIKKRGVK